MSDSGACTTAMNGGNESNLVLVAASFSRPAWVCNVNKTKHDGVRSGCYLAWVWHVGATETQAEGSIVEAVT